MSKGKEALLNEDKEVLLSDTSEQHGKAPKTSCGKSVMSYSDDLRALFKCPVCSMPMFRHIYQCPNGHTICKNCRLTTHYCPTCSKAMGNIRCLALEKLVDSLEFPCRFQHLGCLAVATFVWLLKHEKHCTFRPDCGGSKCLSTMEVFVEIHADIPATIYAIINAALENDKKNLMMFNNGSTSMDTVFAGLLVQPSFSVYDVKSILSFKIGIQPDHQVLSCAGKVLDDSQKLEDYGIGVGEVLCLSLNSSAMKQSSQKFCSSVIEPKLEDERDKGPSVSALQAVPKPITMLSKSFPKPSGGAPKPLSQFVSRGNYSRQRLDWQKWKAAGENVSVQVHVDPELPDEDPAAAT